MLVPGQEVMIVGNSGCNPGTVVNVKHVFVADTGHGSLGLYTVTPRQEVAGREVLFEEDELFPVADAEVTTPGGLFELSWPE